MANRVESRRAGLTPLSGARHGRNQLNGWLVALLILAILLASSIYLFSAWNRYRQNASDQAIQLARSLASLFHAEHIAALADAPENPDTNASVLMQNSLNGLVFASHTIHRAYLLAQHDGEILVLLDAGLYGTGHMEENESRREPFRTGQTILTGPVSDKQGTWVCVLVPMRDPADQRVCAVLGFDLAASEWTGQIWKRLVPDAVIAICVLFLFFTFLRNLLQHAALKRLTGKLAAQEALYRSVFDLSPIGIAIVRDDRFVSRLELGNASINPAFEAIIGRTSQELENLTWPEITYADDLKADLEHFEPFKAGEVNGYTLEKRFVRPDGTPVWTRMIITRLIDLLADQRLHLCLIEDISEHLATATALCESERSKSILLSHLPGLAFRCRLDRDWTMQYVSAGCLALTGYPPESLVDNKIQSYVSLVDPVYREQLFTARADKRQTRQSYRVEYPLTAAGGEIKWVMELGQTVGGSQGKGDALEGIILDITDRKKMENELRTVNERDAWTGLPNRRVLERMLESDNKDQRTENRAIVSINCTPVQLLTKTYGFHYTQDQLKKTAELLRLFCSGQRQLFSTYWDRFVFYLTAYESREDLLDFCAILSARLTALFKSERIGGGIGVLEIESGCSQDVDQLLKKVLIASEKSMNHPEASFQACFFGPDIESELIRTETIKRDLLDIVDDEGDGGLVLQFQPILDLPSNRICGFEALCRLNSASLGRVPPLEFIPLAEETKLIIPIGLKIIRKAFRFLRNLLDLGYTDLTVSVNISAIQLLQHDFVEQLLQSSREIGVSPEHIGIELTESILATDYDEINHTISTLRQLGIHVAIDDFGTGYSSFAREQALRVDCLKIDKQFIDSLLDDQLEHAITGDIISMAHKLGHYAIAEGVEEEKQLQQLRRWHCDQIQGYLIGRPLDEEAAIAFLDSQPWCQAVPFT
ncbi:MAG: EAL domain-containing protein [Eubacteriales bacterium]|nr:EAL domain-containing protein [Eubacteriales bacterium]